MVTRINISKLDPEVQDFIEALQSDIEETEEALEAVTKVADEREAELVTLRARTVQEDVSKADTDEAFEAVLKSADPAVAAILKAQRKQNEILAAQVKKQADDDLDRTMLAKAKSFAYVSGDPDELAAVLKECFSVPSVVLKADGTPETKTLGDKVESLLKAVNAQLESANLFGELGQGGADSTISKSVETRAAELRKADPALTAEQAIAKVYEDNPELYAQTIKEG